MASENSPQARAKADVYAKQQAAQKKLQALNEAKGAPVVKVGTKAQAVNGKPPIKAPLKPGVTPTTVTATEAYDTDSESFIFKSFLPGGAGKQNPPFIYPGRFDRPVDRKGTRKIERGYIRRLTEFYDKQTASENGTLKLDKSTPSTVTNMRCNFQFNPDNITRMVTAESDMTFFFNQDPSQLAQPVPGKAGFSFELLFNREAEVASSIYLSKDGKDNYVENLEKNIDNLNPIGIASSWIGKPHEPQWVTKIGVLADILLLDDVIGQGLAKDILDKINDPTAVGPNGTKWGFDATNSPGSPTNPSSSGTTTTKAIDSARYDAYSMNMGNKAYLTPTPVRIMFTKWMMVEGFVQSVQVTFNKFSKNMIPTQASVMIQMQALYMGFAQQKTFLTDLPNIQVGQGLSPGNVIPSPTTIQGKAYQFIDDLLVKKSFFDKENTVNKKLRNTNEPSSIEFSELFQLRNTEIDFHFDKWTEIVKYGAEVIEKLKDDGIQFEVYWDGVIKVYWHEHAVASDGSEFTGSNSRGVISLNAGSGYKYKAGPPPNNIAPATDYKLWGTEKEPMVITSIGNQGFPLIRNMFVGDDLMYFSDVDGPKRGKNVDTHTTKWAMQLRNGTQDSQRTSGQLLVPFKQDKFTVDIGIRWYIRDTLNDAEVYLYDWHKAKYTSEVSKFWSDPKHTYQSEWLWADLNAMDYRDKGTGTVVTGNGVRWFDEVKKYLGGTLG